MVLMSRPPPTDGATSEQPSTRERQRPEVYIHCFSPMGGREHDLARSISQQAHAMYIHATDYTPVSGLTQSPPPSPTPFE